MLFHYVSNFFYLIYFCCIKISPNNPEILWAEITILLIFNQYITVKSIDYSHSSMAIAVASPPPMHKDATPLFLLVRLSA